MDQVEEIKSKIDIVKVVGEHVQLTKAGRNFKGLCPFHQERTPSFMVSTELQIFTCFGCHEKGDVITFLEKIEGLEFYDVLKILAVKSGVKLIAPQGEKYSEKEKLIEANETAAKFYNYILLSHKSGVEALDYLTKKREISLETIKKFNLGFAPDISDELCKFLISKKGFSIVDLEKAGLVIRSRGRSFDRFRGRIIFPLLDHRGTCVGLAGRILPSIEAKLPKDKHLGKYVNSPETAIYHKSSMLYGLDVTKQEIKKTGFALVVEGEVDFLSVWQKAIKNIVAIKGTALTAEQIKILSRFTDTLILALDSDVAGDAASRKGISLAQAQGLKVKVLKPSKKYKDPDEFVKNDLEGFKKALEEAESVWDFLIDSVFSKFNEVSGEGKQGISREIIPVLASIDDKIVQSHYVSLVAGKLSVPKEAVESQVAKNKVEDMYGHGETRDSLNMKEKDQKDSGSLKEALENQNKNRGRREILEERLVALAFQKDPKMLLESRELVISAFVLKIVDYLKEYLGKNSKAKFSLQGFAFFLPGELRDGFSQIILSGDIEVDEEDIQIDKEIELVKKELKVLILKSELEGLAREISVLENQEKEEDLKELTKRYSLISRQLFELDRS